MQMHQLDKRIRKMLETLEELSVIQSVPIQNIQMAPRNSRTWVDFKNGGFWGDGENEWVNFRFTAVVPENFRGRVRLNVLTGHASDWEAANPQILAWVDDQIVQAFDSKHHDLVLSETPEHGREYNMLLEGYVPKPAEFQSPARMLIRLMDINAEVEALIYDIRIPWRSACLCPEGNRDRERTFEILSDALNLLDLRNPQSEAFNASVSLARDYLRREYYEKRRSLTAPAVADCIGHTHIDCAWLWDLYQSRHKAARSFSTMLNLMERYPEFKFMSSQPLLYKFVKEDHPELYERIKEAVSRGQWQPEGGMWVEADCNISSGESLVRQFLHGQEFFRKEFGQPSRVLWLPDVFGYSAALPQILKKSGIDYFMTSKLSWSEFNLSPYDTFLWKGIDGSEVLTHFTPARDANELAQHEDLSYFTTYNAMLGPEQIKGGWQRFQQKALDDHYLVCYGYGDGGGGSTDWMIENARRMAFPMPDMPVVRQCMPRQFFEELEARVKDDPRLPKWSGELYLEYHRGTYTAMARNKRFNRKMELALRDAEFLCTLAHQLNGAEYPAQQLHDLWETVLTLQFHDILPGSSIKKVYDDSLKMYTDAMKKVREIRQQAMDSIAGVMDGDVIAFNTLSAVRNDIVWFEAPADVTALRDTEGREYPVQFVEGKACAFVRDIPSMGVKALWFIRGKRSGSALHLDHKGFDTPYFSGSFDPAMRISSLKDKRCGRELCKPGKSLNSIVCYENRPHNWDAWDINIYYDQRKWDVDEVTSTEIISCGPVLARLRVQYTFNKSTISQDITFYADIDRIDFDTTVDWHEEHYLLKSHFPADIFYNDASFDIQYGNVRRATHKNTSWDIARFEVCAHKWADISEARYGLSLMNDCKYGHSVDENSIALTLLKSSTYPNPEADREIHHFTYAIMPHPGGWREADIPIKAYMLNVPVLTAAGHGEKTSLPPFAKIDHDNVILEVVKQELDGDSTILRLYECYGARTDIILTLDHTPKSVRIVNLMEEDLGEASFKGNHIFLTLRPYEILTLKL